MAAVLAFSGLALAADAPAAGGAGFTIQDKAGEYLDVLLDGKTVTRYMYAYDTSTPARKGETYKPYMHVFDAEAGIPITKGPGGEFTHHRGIFIGWMKIQFDGKSYDRWHMKGGEIVHQKFTAQEADKDHATFTSLTKWMVGEGDKAIIEEERTTTLRRGPGGSLLIDFTSKLNAPNGEVKLDGDPEHAGIQFRPASEVDRKETTYVFPKEGANAHKDRDYPWVGETFVIKDKKYSVVDMNHPANPRDTAFSAYRDYGRFGAFPKATLKSGESLTLKYRFWVTCGEMPAVESIQKCWDEYAGVKEATAAPKTTVIKSEQKAPTSKPAKAAAKTEK